MTGNFVGAERSGGKPPALAPHEGGTGALPLPVKIIVAEY